MSNKQSVQNLNTQRNAQEFNCFIQSNKSYLQQKYNEHILGCLQKNQQKPQIPKITNFPVQKLICYLFEIFSLQRYQKNKKVYQLIKNSVEQNVKEYMQNLNANQIKKEVQITFHKFLQILVFIVSKNSIFAIQYETKNKDQVFTNNQSQKYRYQNKNLNINVELGIQMQISSQNFNNQENKSFNQNYQRKDMKNSFLLMENQFQMSDEPLENDKCNVELIKKNAKILFDFYCRQQMELGGVITFDRLSQETSSLSLGKCLTFAKATNLFNVFITKENLISKFKKIAQGKKNIDFQKFYRMISQFEVLDPNFNQRMGLLSEDIKKVIKYVKLPFNTKDTAPRQKIAIRKFSNKLTGHSGKTGDILKQQLLNKKFEQQNQTKINQIKRYFHWKQNRSDIVSQKDLGITKKNKLKDLTVDLSFIGSLVHPEQQDQTYLKGYIVPKLSRQISKISNQEKIPKKYRYHSSDMINLRKQTVVSDIKKRIKQIQSSQKFSQNKKLRRSQISQILSPKKRYSHF